MDQSYKEFLVTDDLKFTIEWSSNLLALINNLDPNQKICIHISEQIGKQVQVCISQNYIAQTIYLREGSYQFSVRDYSKFSQVISTDPKRVNIPSPIVAICELPEKHSLLLFTKDFEIYSFSWKLPTQDCEVDPYAYKQSVKLHLHLELRSKYSSENQIQMEGKLIRMKYEQCEGFMTFYLQSSNSVRIYKVQYKEGQTYVQSCISTDEESSIMDFDVYKGRVYATLIRQKQNQFTLAITDKDTDKFVQEKEIDQIDNSFQINTHLFNIVDSFKRIDYNYIIVSYLLKKQDNQNQLKVILIDLNQQLMLENQEILEKRIAIGTISSTNNRAENIQALQFKKSVQLKRNNKVFVPLYEKTALGNENTIIVSTIQLQKAEIGCIESNQEQCDNLFQQLVLQKNQIYDKNYNLIKPNPLIEEYIQKQQKRIPQYILECNLPFSQGSGYDAQSLKFLYFLIVNKQHTLLTDIINTRTIVRSNKLQKEQNNIFMFYFINFQIENKEVCEYLILNLELLERELYYLLFKNHVLEHIKQTNFQNLSKEDYKEFYELVQIVSEIFNSILVRKQKEAFEDMRERNLPCYSQEHQNSISNANAVIEQIASKISVIKISGWLLDQEFQGQSLSHLLFSQQDYTNITLQTINQKLYKQQNIISERNQLLCKDLDQDNILFSDKIFLNFGFQKFDPILMIREQNQNKNVGINLHSFTLYRYIFELTKVNEDFEIILQNYERELSSISNNGYVSSISNTSCGQLFRCLCMIDDLNFQNRFEIFNLIIENFKTISMLDSELIVFIIGTFAAHSFKEEAFILIRQFNKSVDWLEGNYPLVLINIYLKFENVSQAISFGLALKQCVRQVLKQDVILLELISSIIRRGQEETLFRQELNPFQDKLIVDAFQMQINAGETRILLVFIKYLIYRNQYLTAMEVFENQQKTIFDAFGKEEVDLIIALFSSILKQYSSVQIQELIQSYSFLTKFNVQKQEGRSSMIAEGSKAPQFESSAIKLYSMQQRNFSSKKPKHNFQDNDFLVLLNFDGGNNVEQQQDQMNIEQDLHMTPQSKERIDTNQNTKSKRKWTTSKKNPSPL